MTRAFAGTDQWCARVAMKHDVWLHFSHSMVTDKCSLGRLQQNFKGQAHVNLAGPLQAGTRVKTAGTGLARVVRATLTHALLQR